MDGFNFDDALTSNATSDELYQRFLAGLASIDDDDNSPSVLDDGLQDEEEEYVPDEPTLGDGLELRLQAISKQEVEELMAEAGLASDWQSAPKRRHRCSTHPYSFLTLQQAHELQRHLSRYVAAVTSVLTSCAVAVVTSHRLRAAPEVVAENKRLFSKCRTLLASVITHRDAALGDAAGASGGDTFWDIPMMGVAGQLLRWADWHVTEGVSREQSAAVELKTPNSIASAMSDDFKCAWWPHVSRPRITSRKAQVGNVHDPTTGRTKFGDAWDRTLFLGLYVYSAVDLEGVHRSLLTAHTPQQLQARLKNRRSRGKREPNVLSELAVVLNNNLLDWDMEEYAVIRECLRLYGRDYGRMTATWLPHRGPALIQAFHERYMRKDMPRSFTPLHRIPKLPHPPVTLAPGCLDRVCAAFPTLVLRPGTAFTTPAPVILRLAPPPASSGAATPTALASAPAAPTSAPTQQSAPAPAAAAVVNADDTDAAARALLAVASVVPRSPAVAAVAVAPVTAAAVVTHTHAAVPTSAAPVPLAAAQSPVLTASQAAPPPPPSTHELSFGRALRTVPGYVPSSAPLLFRGAPGAAPTSSPVKPLPGPSLSMSLDLPGFSHMGFGIHGGAAGSTTDPSLIKPMDSMLPFNLNSNLSFAGDDTNAFAPTNPTPGASAPPPSTAAVPPAVTAAVPPPPALPSPLPVPAAAPVPSPPAAVPVQIPLPAPVPPSQQAPLPLPADTPVPTAPAPPRAAAATPSSSPPVTASAPPPGARVAPVAVAPVAAAPVGVDAAARDPGTSRVSGSSAPTAATCVSGGDATVGVTPSAGAGVKWRKKDDRRLLKAVKASGVTPALWSELSPQLGKPAAALQARYTYLMSVLFAP